MATRPGPNSQLTKRVNAWEQKQKDKLVELGSGDKPWPDILRFLKNEIEQSTKMSNFHYKLLCFKNDGAYQLNRAIEEVYGVAQGKGDDRPSGGEANLETLDIQLADGRRLKVPYGTIALPEAGDGASIEIAYNTGTTELIIQGSCQFQYASMIDEIVDRTKELLNTDSIYKSQAITIVNDKYEPQISDLSNIDKEFMVLPKTTIHEMKPLMARIERPEECIANNIPLKLGVLFEGDYGTGKTLCAFKTARIATKNSWSFVYLKDPKLLARTLMLCKTLDKSGYGVVVFVEDVDQVTKGERDQAMQDILNTLDGGDTKQMNIIAIFTTNHLRDINPTFLRGKRIGSLVSFGALDAETAIAYMEHTFKEGYVLEQEGLDKISKEVEKAGIVPAFMAEICEKVKANMVFEDDNTVKAEYIRAALNSYLRQVDLARTKQEKRNPAEEFVDSFRKIMFDRDLHAEENTWDKVAKEILE